MFMFEALNPQQIKVHMKMSPFFEKPRKLYAHESKWFYGIRFLV